MTSVQCAEPSLQVDALGVNQAPTAPIRVFVHLARDKDLAQWRRAFESGALVGVNDATPYGYGRAEAMGCRLSFSSSAPEHALATFVRLAIRAIMGFDYLHARRQIDELTQADIVWTHTESQYLAVAAVLHGRRSRPRLLGQSVWLFDHWPRLSPPCRELYRRLMRDVDILTVHSSENLNVARGLFPHKKTALVPFGIPCERTLAPRMRPSRPIRILSLGSDRHRDWATLLEAVRGQDNMLLTILSGSARPSLARGMRNARIARAANNAELEALMAQATLVCVPLKPNLHASGITVIQEAALAGVPVIASATGGLSDYFSSDQVRYVAPGDVLALRQAILALAADPDAACAMARRAQARMADGTMGADAFIRRHVDISRELLAR